MTTRPATPTDRTPTLDQLLTVPQVATRLQVDVVTVRRMIARHELPGYKVGRTYRVAPADLVSYLAAQAVAAGPAQAELT